MSPPCTRKTACLMWLIASFLFWHLALGQLDVARNKEWNVWKAKYQKNYRSLSEELAKRAVWERNLALVQKHNSQSGRMFELALNQFGDKQMTNRQHIVSSSQSYSVKKTERLVNLSIPKSVDWRKKGVVTPVRNQGDLGQSVALAAADAVASFHAIHTGHLHDLSVKEVLDCCTSHQPRRGVDIFDCIHHIGGLCTNMSYTYNDGKCNDQSCKPYAKVPTGGKSVAKGSEEALTLAVAIEPVLVMVDASQLSFSLYTSGVYFSSNCSSDVVDHSLFVVGYGSTKDGVDYWICKNSWGKSWGVKGYILMARNRNNMCGIATEAAYPS